MVKRYKWYHWALFALGFLALAAVTIYIAAAYESIAAEVPTHFNSLGEADAYGGKSSLLAPLAIGWILYASTTIVAMFPAVWNTGVAVTERNREKVYSIIITMISVVAFAMAALLSCTVFCASQGRSVPVFAIPVFLILVFGSIITGIIRLVRNR